MYRLFYGMMIVGYIYCSLNVPTLRMKIIGLLLAIVNSLLFYK